MTGGGQVEDATSRWLTSQRFSGLDDAARRDAQAELDAIRDRVLDGAEIRAGGHVVDLGAGTGLLTLAALDAVGPAGTVTAVDLSAPALEAIDPPDGGGTLRTVVADVTALPLPDNCADAVVARSVLIYVSDLAAAIGEAARTVREGGRLSVFEPVNARRTHDADLRLRPAELDAVGRVLADVTPAARSMLAFGEQKTAALVAKAFGAVDLTAGLVTEELPDPDAATAALRRSSHPGAPTALDAVAAALGQDVATRYADAWREAAERQGRITYRTPVVYITARKS